MIMYKNVTNSAIGDTNSDNIQGKYKSQIVTTKLTVLTKNLEEHGRNSVTKVTLLSK